MKSVNCSKLSIIAQIFLVFIVMVYACDSLAAGKCRAWYQQVYTPDSMKTSAGYFDPKIRVCAAWNECDTCWDYSPGHCGYLWPANFITYYLWPDVNKSPCPDDCSKGCGDCSPKKPQLCACQTFACNLPWDPDNWASSCMSGALLGCVELPLAPGPPPFCPSFGGHTTVNVVPVAFSNQSFFKPSIRAIVTTAEGGKFSHNFIHNFNLKGEGPKQGVSGSDGITNIFSTSKGGSDSICLNYYGIDSNGPLISSSCAPTPSLAKPIVLPGGSENKIRVEIPGCSGEDYCNTEHEVNTEIVKDSGIFVINPMIDPDHKFVTRRVCADGSTPDASGLCQDKTVSTVQYLSNPSGKVKCLVNWPITPGEYVINRDGRFIWLKTYGKKLVRNAITVPNGRPVKCSDNFSVNIDDLPQSCNVGATKMCLDNAISYSGGYYQFKGVSNNPINDTTDRPCENSFAVYGYDESVVLEDIYSNSHCQETTVQEYNGSSHTFCTSRYYDEDSENRQPFFPTKKELDPSSNLLVARDPDVSGLCIDSFARTDYTDTSKDLFYVVGKADDKKCQFVKLEAWGGGAAGMISGGDFKDSLSGSSGDFATVTVNTSSDSEYNVFKVNVGHGGSGDSVKNVKGQNTTVSLCKQKKSSGSGNSDEIKVEDCRLLITAGGGDANLTYDQAIAGAFRSVNRRFKVGLQSKKDGEAKDEDNKALTPYISLDAPSGYYETDGCKSAKQGSLVPGADNKRTPGAGGCINKANGVRQSGADGRVSLTCEIWSD